MCNKIETKRESGTGNQIFSAILIFDDSFGTAISISTFNITDIA
ncbi:hypothetical protein CKA32_000247 [Geitlerinema sp. FC II]|nr:hypothetical protein CKA32_000247 [Geitlerinema sp. FC II]